MRRMYSDGQVVKVVNKAIDDGEIQAGGLTPEQEEKIDNALQLPESAPAAQQLVGINTSGEQNALNIGDGLTVDIGTLKVVDNKTLILDFNGSTTKTITQEEADNINNFVYDKVILQNFKTQGISLAFVDSSKKINAIMPVRDSYTVYFSSRAYALEEKMQIISDSESNTSYGEIANTALRANVGFFRSPGGKLNLSGTTLSVTTNTYIPCIHLDPRYRHKATAANLSGTLPTGITLANYFEKFSKSLLDAVIVWQPASDVNKYILFKVVSTFSTGTNDTSYAILKAEDIDYDNGTITTYLMKWFTSTGAYTIKTIA